MGINQDGWPAQLESGGLVFFHTNLERVSPDVGIPLVMVRSQLDGSDQLQIRPEEFHISEALWADDASSAVILGRCCGGPRHVILARTDGGPLQVLVENAEEVRSLAWGP